METQVNPEKMVAPPTAQTQMVAPQQKGQKTYKVICLQPFQVGEITYKDGRAVESEQTRIAKVGEVVEVSRARAKDLCSKIQGSYAFSGERHNADKDIVRHDLTRARLATPADLVSKTPLTPIDSKDDVLGD